MFKTILVPLDGSSRAEAALPVARRIAQNTGATLVLVQAVSFLSEYWPTMATTAPSLTQAVVEADLEQATAYLNTIATAPEMAGVVVKTAAHFGPPAPTILTVASSYNCDLIVMCSHGSTGMIHWLMGSVAEKVARSASLPVLVVRAEGLHLESGTIGLAQPLRMLIPLDGSEGAKAALEPGAELLLAMAAPGQRCALHLARVASQSVGEHQTPEHSLQESNEVAQAKGSLQQTTLQIREGILAPYIREHKLPVTWSLLRDTDIAGALLHIAEQGEDMEGAGTFGGCDLIAISTHGRSGLQRWVLGSIAERMLHATKRPILIVHPPKSTGEEKRVPEGENLALHPLVHLY